MTRAKPNFIRNLALTATLGFIAGAGGAYAALKAGDLVVSQKGRAFDPAEVTLAKGQTLTVVNDDEFLHHGYIEAPEFKFDSGSQPIGSETDIKFTEIGVFELRCAIHPKMLLTVTVTE